MKKLQFLSVFIFTLLVSNFVTAQNVTVTGNAYLENQTNHDSISVIFERTAPTTLKDTFYSNTVGNYTASIPTGIYNVTFKKNNYLDATITGQALYANTTLSNTTLESLGLSGNLTGVIAKNTYKITGNIKVPSGQTLTIEAGTKFIFKTDVVFEVEGTLMANGNVNDTIVFTSNDTTPNWKGIKFNTANSNSKMSYCIVEKSKENGLTVNICSPSFSNLIIRRNYGPANLTNYDGGGGIKINQSNSIFDSILVIDNYCELGGGIFCGFSNIEIKNSDIIKNKTFNYGGGIFLYKGNNVKIINSKIQDNYTLNQLTPNSADGIYSESLNKCEIINSLISNNNGKGINFPNIFDSPFNIFIKNSIITNNTDDGIYFSKTKIYISNSIISKNKGYGINNDNNNASVTFDHLSFNNIFNNTLGNFYNCNQWIGKNVTVNSNNDSCDAYFNIQKDPMFVSNTDFHLQYGSPCIDAGVNDSVAFAFDMDNNNRIFDGDSNGVATVDMGVYEFNKPFYLSIKNNEKEVLDFDVKLYPNPSNNLINIYFENNENTYVEIININSQKIISKPLENNIVNKINISDLQTGIYFIRVYSKNKIWNNKLIKY